MHSVKQALSMEAENGFKQRQWGWGK